MLATLIRNFREGEYAQRREAAIALSKFKGQEAAGFLLQNYESDNIQDFMALALGNLEDKKAVQLLVNALNDTQQEVRFNAAQALGMVKNEEAFNVLMEALNEYADSNAAGLAPNTQAKIFFEEEAIISAITALGRIKNLLSIPLLKRLLAQEKSGRIRASIIMALGMMANERMLPIFQGALRDEDPRVRANAIESIESIKSSSIVGIIQPYLEDPNNRVRANVAKAIWKYGDFDVSETLNQMLGHGDKWYRASAAYAMGEIKDVRFITKLVQALKDDDPDVRRNAANAMKKIQSPNAIAHLTPLMEDPNYDVRVQAVLAISRCNQKKAAEIFSEKLKTESNSIVLATLVSTLGESGHVPARGDIINLLADADPRVVSNAIEAIQKLTKGSPEPDLIDRFKGLLSHDDNRVKSTAIKTLWGWNEFGVLDNLNELLLNPDPKHRQSATFVVGEIGKAISRNVALTKAVNDAIAQLLAEQGAGLEPAATSPEAPSTGEGEAQEAAAPPKPDPEAEIEKDLELAMNALNSKEFRQAEKTFLHVLEVQPQNLKALLGIGNLYFLLKKYSDAANYYEKALETNPTLVKAHYNLGTIFYFIKAYEKSKVHLLKALELYPKLLGAYLILAQVYQLEGKTSDSIILLGKAVELSPRNPILYQKLAILHIHLRQFEPAIGILEKAVSLSPLDIESNLYLAFCNQLLGKPAEAFDAIDLTLKACAQSPQPEEALKILLQSYLFIKSSGEQPQ